MTDTRTFRLKLDRAYDLTSTVFLLKMGNYDPCFRIDSPQQVRMVIAAPEGPLVLTVRHELTCLQVQVTGAQPDWIEPYLSGLLGLDFTPPQLNGKRSIRLLAHNHRGMHLPRLPILFPRVVQTVLQQLVSFRDSCFAWRKLVEGLGEPIEGEEKLKAPPTPSKLARLSSEQCLQFGILPEFGRRVVTVAKVADRIESTWNHGRDPDAVSRTCELLGQLHGVGPWTIGFLQGSAMGDPDALVPGDYSFPKQVVYFFERNEMAADLATDEDMFERLSPYEPYRYYLLSLILKGGPRLPRKGPRRRSVRERMGR